MTHGLVTPGRTLKERATRAVADAELQRALHNLDVRLFTARDVEDNHRALKDKAAAIRRETLADLDGWLDKLEATLVSLDVTVHRCATPDDARRVVLDLARREGVHRVVKSKSMATEEIDLSDALEANGMESIETDLGEYIVQLAGERPSHIITPVIHKTLPQIADVLSREAGAPLAVDREVLTEWTREKLRKKFVAADMGITGANFVAADTGTIVVVTNEGNGRFCTSLPRIHVCVMPIEKVVPRFADLATLLPLLTMSATGQRLSNYVSMVTGPRRPGEVDGPEHLHVIFLDHNRRDLVGTRYESMLACIRCGACLNVCPVYRKIGGHAYDSVYSGPMGKILTPLLSAGADGRDLPGASSLCGACAEACPVQIPLADLLVRLREDLRSPGPVVAGVPSVAAKRTRPRARRLGFGTWAAAWASPAGYRASMGAARLGRRILGRDGWAHRAPGLRGWTAGRDLPLPAACSFRDRWDARREGDDQW